MSLLSGQQQSRAAVLPSRSHRPRCGVPRSALADPADVAADAVARAVTLARRATEEEEAEEAGPPGDGDGDGTPPASPSLSLAEAVPSLSLAEAVAKRRCWAIISHPDAGKTTLTEKLLLYGGAIHEAGEVRARRGAKSATSDWMAIEKERGISISSTAMSFNYGGFCLNLLDTPGHADFSEDTYRTLSAADNALMLVDAGKGLEPQTRKLFEVCRRNGLPLFTFINKLDREALSPFELCDQIEKEFKLPTFPVNWPIGCGDRFKGVYDRPSRTVRLFRKVASGSQAASEVRLPLDDPSLPGLLGGEAHAALVEDAQLLDELGAGLDLAAVWRGELTPVFFGSAANNFGVQAFLDSFLQYAAVPRSMPLLAAAGASGGAAASQAPTSEHFSGFVFKLQQNMDPRHRDKVAFVRVVSGEFRRGITVLHTRTGRRVALTRPQKLFGQERETTEVAYAGDILGLNNPGLFAVGDTLCTGPAIAFPAIPSFSPELFATIRCSDTGKRKNFQKGVGELLSEGAVQALYPANDMSNDVVLAAVGQLQFEVVLERLRTEYGVPCTLDPLPYTVARWVAGGWPAVTRAGRLFNALLLRDGYGRPVLLFRSVWNVDTLLQEAPDIGELSSVGVAPTAAEAAAAAAAGR